MLKRSTRLTDADLALLRAHPLFSGLGRALFDDLALTVSVILAGKNQVLFSAGDKAEQFYIITDGAVRLFRSDSDGAESTVGLFGSEQSFGEAAIFLERAFPVTAQAIEESRIVRVNAVQIVRRIRLEPELALGLLASMSGHLKLLVDEISLLRTAKVSQRLATFLLGLTPTQSGTVRFDLPYAKTVIASRLGITPESLSRGFAELRKAGVGVNRKTITIDDVARLRRILR